LRRGKGRREWTGRSLRSARDEGEGRAVVGTGSGASEFAFEGLAKGGEMGFAIGRRASLFSRDFITERESRTGSDALISAVSKEFASAADSNADGAGLTTRTMATEDDGSA